MSQDALQVAFQQGFQKEAQGSTLSRIGNKLRDAATARRFRSGLAMRNMGQEADQRLGKAMDLYGSQPPNKKTQQAMMNLKNKKDIADEKATGEMLRGAAETGGLYGGGAAALGGAGYAANQYG